MYGKKIVLTTCVSMLLIALMFPAMTTSASTYTVGVKAGDRAEYGDISFEYASNWPGYEDPSSAYNMSWMDMEVLDIYNSNVTLRSTVIYGNETEETFVMSGNIATGEGNLSVGIIPSNLGAGDEIPADITEYTAEPLKVVINGTVTRSYADANREVNYVNITYPIIYGDVQYGTMNMSLYWDKKTGIMCEEVMSYAMSYTLPNSTHWYMNMSMMLGMTETNMWSAEVAFWMQWWFWTIIAVVIVALAGTVYFLRKRKPPTSTAPTSPT